MKIFNFPRQILIAFLLVLIICAASWALLKPNLFVVHDYIHAARIAEMQRGLAQGQFPVRWSGNFGYGYGMPLFQFYAPLPYLFGALLTFVAVPTAFIVKLLFLIPTVVSALGSYFLGKLVFKQRVAAIVVSAAFTLSSYRAVNLFVRGAVSESWAMALLPLILYFGIKVIQGNRSSWKFLSLSVAGLLLSHNITSMLFLPVSALLLFAIHYYERHNIKNLLIAAASYTLAVIMTTFYWLPAILEKQFTIMDSAILSGYFDYHMHFLYIRQFFEPMFKYGGSVWGPDDDISFFLGWGQLISLGLLAVVGLLFVWKNRRKLSYVLRRNQFVYTLMFGLVALGSLYLSLLKALPIWETLPFLAFVQFPWRLLSVAVLFISLLTGAAIYFSPKGIVRYLLAISLLLIIISTSTGYFQPEHYLDNDDALYYTDASKIKSDMSGILPDYIPLSLNLNLPVAHEPYISQEQIEYTVVVNRAHQKSIDLVSDIPTQFTFNIADYPGWTVYLNGEETDKAITKDGLVAVEVPEGNHRVSANLEPTLVRMWSDILSAAGILALILLLVYEHKLEIKDE